MSNAMETPFRRLKSVVKLPRKADIKAATMPKRSRVQYMTVNGFALLIIARCSALRLILSFAFKSAPFQ